MTASNAVIPSEVEGSLANKIQQEYIADMTERCIPIGQLFVELQTRYRSTGRMRTGKFSCVNYDPAANLDLELARMKRTDNLRRRVMSRAARAAALDVLQ